MRRFFLPGPVNSTADVVTLSNGVRVNNTNSNTITTNTLTLGPNVECDAAPCIASNTLADKIVFSVELGLGTDGVYNAGGTVDFNASKEYVSIDISANSTLNFTGDTVTKVQTGFKILSDSTINIDGDVTLYADDFSLGTRSYRYEYHQGDVRY